MFPLAILIVGLECPQTEDFLASYIFGQKANICSDFNFFQFLFSMHVSFLSSHLHAFFSSFFDKASE